jgi:hypothetical protein
MVDAEDMLERMAKVAKGTLEGFSAPYHGNLYGVQLHAKAIQAALRELVEVMGLDEYRDRLSAIVLDITKLDLTPKKTS